MSKNMGCGAGESMKKTQKQAPAAQWEDRGPFSTFARELSQWSRTGAAPRSADSDLRYAMDLQKDRLDRLGLELEYDISPRGVLDGTGSRQSRTRRAGRFEMEESWRSCLLETRIHAGEKTLFFRREREILYLTLTRFRGGELPAQAPCTCPACGAVSMVETLSQKGCPYCGGRFTLGELYPKITGYYFVRDSGMTKEEFKTPVLRLSLIFGGFWLVAGLPGMLMRCFDGGFHPWPLVGGLLSAALFGGIFGYVAYVLYLLAVLFREAAGSLQLLPGFLRGRRRLTEFFRDLDPDFSYEFFLGKMASLAKRVLLAEDPGELPDYGGGALPEFCRDILDVSFRGGLGLGACRREGNRVSLNVTVFATCLERGKHGIRRRNRAVTMTVCRELGPEEPMALRRVQCPACGGSFDATRLKCCPYCDSPYDRAKSTWVAEAVQVI